MTSPGAAADSTTTANAADVSSTNPHSLHQAVRARRSEFVRRHRLRIKIGTWNVAACPGTDKDLARWFIDGEGLDPALGSAKQASDDAEERGSVQGGPPDSDGPIQLTDAGKVGLYVLGLQEVNVLSAPSQYMTWIYAADDSTTGKWKAALEAALPADYRLVASEQLAGLLLLAYASPEIAPTITNVSTITVGTGALGYLGNKGAVCTRIVLGEATQLLFVNCHLASGVEDYYLERRISQAEQIMSQARFEPISIAGVSEEERSKIGDEDFAFWFGDLNFRLDRLPGDDIRRLLMLHTRGEYDLSKRELRRESSLDGEPIVVHRLSDSSDEVADRDPGEQPQEPTEDKAADSPGGEDNDSLNLPDPDEFPQNPHEDPASLQATLDSLLPHDQLRRLVKERKIFHEGWREGPISFLPTYKYDVGTVALFDSSEKRRPPSWCDRILYRTRRDMDEYQRKAREEEESRRRDEEMKARGVEGAGDDDDVLFSYDPDNDGDEQPASSAGLEYDEYDEAEDGGDDQATNQSGHERIHLDLYTSHQRITSSDHKPVSSVFTLDHDAVVPELKATVHAEVARELDRAENEGRPGITIVVDHHDVRDPARHSNSESSAHVDFGDVRFLTKYTSSLTLANTSGVPAVLSFVERPTTDDSEGDASTQTQWLTTSFVHPDATGDDDTESVDLGKEVPLEPGETVNAVMDALVNDVAHARMLNEGQLALEEVLVLRVTDGRDHFIPVHASWVPTCIGRSVEELIRVPDGGIRTFAKSLTEHRGRAGAIPYDLAVHRPAPKELFKLTEAIETLAQRVLADAQMLEDCTIPSDPGWPFEETTCKSTDTDTRTAHIIALLDALDQDESITSAFAPETPSLARLEAVSQTLLLFLRGLTDGVIPTGLWNRIEQAAASIPSLANPNNNNNNNSNNPAVDEAALDDDRTTILDILQSAPNHNICFVFLTTALARVVAELSPLSKGELDILRENAAASSSSSASSVAAAAAPVRGIGSVFGVGRKSLSFVWRSPTPVAEALAALDRRRARERRVAEIFGTVVCRAVAGQGGAKEKRAGEARRRAVVELFLRRRGE
ncbi:Endonuclease/exonuclease/phosphatase [Chaetomidium leptoderma]|uniref:Endonuclease/exonuclease/phosphatase n=1 Tax=Chaetomidium leptoderma TaxID=669021 RepID=A0AAN6VGV2_9PEZI|nr:Endonuclease/exonuclease/phosphatase [Chaetomidium leptoderma]